MPERQLCMAEREIDRYRRLMHAGHKVAGEERYGPDVDLVAHSNGARGHGEGRARGGATRLSTEARPRPSYLMKERL